MTAPVLQISDLAKSVPGGRVLFEGLNLRLAAGEFVAIMGESGVGKSTLLNLIAGLDQADAGVIAIDGVDLAGLDDDARTGIRGFPHRLGARASGLLAFACLAVATLLISIGPGLPPRPLLIAGLVIGLAASVAGVVLLLRRSPTRLLMQLIMTCAVVDVVMLALAGQSITV